MCYKVVDQNGARTPFVGPGPLNEFHNINIKNALGANVLSKLQKEKSKRFNRTPKNSLAITTHNSKRVSTAKRNGSRNLMYCIKGTLYTQLYHIFSK